MKDKAPRQGRFLLLYFVLIFSLAGFTYPNASFAEEDYFDLPPELLLNAQIISVSKRPATLADVPAAVSIVTAEDIQRSGVTTIPDALRLVPGVNVAQADSNSWAVSIRGFNSVLANKLLVMIDGRTIYNPVFGGTFWEAHDLVMEDIERIEVVRGPGGTLWGANAVNGVINIITKRAQDTQGNLVSTLYGNEEKGTLSMRHGGSFAEDGYYRLYAKGFNRDSFKDPDGGDAYDEWDGYRTGFRVDRGENFTLQGDVYRLQENQFRNESFLVAPVSILRRQHLKYEGANLLGRWQGKRDDGSSVSVQTYLDWTRRNEPYNFVDNRTIFDIEAQYNWPIMGRHEIIGGAGYRFAADNEEITRNTSFDPLGRRDSLYSAFIQDKIELAPDRWYLTLGSKFEHNEYSGFEIQPSARLQYQPDDHQTWWAAVSRAVRTPTPIEEDLTSTLATAVNVRAAFVPNDDFKSEVLNAYELGYRNQITPTLSADVATFFNVYDHLETTAFLTPFLVNNGVDPLHLFIPVQFQNNMRGRTYGIEFSTDWLARPDLKVTANYSFLHMALEADDPSQETAEDSYPAHQLGLRASWTIDENWSLDVGAAYVSRLKNPDVDAYVRMDVNLGWKIDNNVRFNLIGQNLTGASHREFNATSDLNASEVERSVFGKITWEF